MEFPTRLAVLYFSVCCACLCIRAGDNLRAGNFPSIGNCCTQSFDSILFDSPVFLVMSQESLHVDNKALEDLVSVFMHLPLHFPIVFR